jgi:hypothetical protein
VPDAGAEADQAEGTKPAEPAGALAAELAARADQLRNELRAWSPTYEPYVTNGAWHDENGTLVLTPKFPSHYDSLARAESKERVARIVANVLGKPVPIRISAGDRAPKVVGGDPRTDTLIQAAVTIYGAELVDDE